VLSQSGLTAARIVSDLHDAKREGRLMLYGQELRSTRDPWTPSRRIEVLARLSTRDGTPVPPETFVPAAERFGVAASIDRWIFRTALRRYGEAMAGDGAFTLGFNLSAQTLSDPLLWDFVAFTLNEAGVPAERVVFEITETAAFQFRGGGTFRGACARGRVQDQPRRFRRGTELVQLSAQVPGGQRQDRRQLHRTALVRQRRPRHRGRHLGDRPDPQLQRRGREGGARGSPGRSGRSGRS